MKDVIIIGGGRSIKDAIETHDLWDKIKHKEIWSLNFAYKFMPYTPTKQVWVDSAVFINYLQEHIDLYAKGVQLVARHRNEVYDLYGFIQTHKSSRALDIVVKSDHKILYSGTLGLCGGFAIDLACKQSYDNIYLLGYDHGTKTTTDKNTHFYLEQAKNLKSDGLKNPFVYLTSNDKLQLGHEDFKYYLRYKDSKIYNVSPDSNIDAFPKISYEQFFTRILDEEQRSVEKL